MKDQHDQLASWERWPLAALFLANALNVFLLYVPEQDMPRLVASLLPWARVACGLAAAASLEGTLIAVTMGRRLGRDSAWSWATMAAASIFTAAVAWYVHSDFGKAAAFLFVGQAVVLFIYTQHLATPRKSLQPENQRLSNGNHWLVREKTPAALPQSASAVVGPTALIERRCSRCGAVRIWTITDVRAHQKTDDCVPVDLHRDLTGSTQQES